MEKYKKISKFIAKLKPFYPKYFNDLKKEDFVILTNTYNEMLGSYSEEALNEVAKDIIKTKKYMPSISEIIELCDNAKVRVRNDIVEKMIDDGYFKDPREIDKIYMWLEEGIVPEWFKKDMMKYYNRMIGNSKQKLIES